MAIKDNFSAQSDQYSRFRPTYPDELYDYLLSLVPARQTSGGGLDTKKSWAGADGGNGTRAWDCGTGNGQVAEKLALFFDAVEATDISREQMAQALPNDKVHYSVQRAEQTDFPAGSFDLITVAQAIHWFDFAAFYAEVERTMKSGGVLAVIGYGLMEVRQTAGDSLDHRKSWELRGEDEAMTAGDSPDTKESWGCADAGLNRAIDRLYRDIVGPYWDAERRYIDEGYRTIPFPYEEMAAPAFEMRFEWSFAHLVGYLGTWSAVKHYQKERSEDPVALVYQELKSCWGTAVVRTVRFPLLLRVTRM